MRMQRGYRRGVPQYEARGKTASEYQTRIIREQQVYGQKPWERFQIGFEQRYGFSYKYWRQLKRRWVDDINQRARHQNTKDIITPGTIASVKSAFDAGWRDNYRPEFNNWQDWVENRLDENLRVRIESEEAGDDEPAKAEFRTRSEVMPVELYWYH
jgi:hypothetical protein